MLRIPLRFLSKRVLPDDAFPFLDRADMEIGFEGEALYGFHFQKALELSAKARPALEHEIAALKHGPDIIEAKLSQEVAEIGHPDLPMPANVDAPQQCDVRGRSRWARCCRWNRCGAGGRRGGCGKGMLSAGRVRMGHARKISQPLR